MFDVLWRIDLDLLTHVMYNVGLRITERDRFPTWREALPIRPGDIPPEAIPVATEVLEEVERLAGKELAEIDEEQMEPLVCAMQRIDRERRERETPYDRERGRRLLEELRRDYGDLSRRVA